MPSFDALERYSRQMLFAPLGRDGQERLQKARVAVLGCGALGSGIVHILARAGVGTIRIVDRDVLELSNLHRQVLFDEQDAHARLPKAVAAAQQIRKINSEVRVEPIVSEIGPANVLSFISDADVVADGSDNMDLRFLLNDACVKLGKPWVYGGAVASRGMTMTIIPGKTPCLRCVLDEMPPLGTLQTCDQIGVLNTLTSIISAVESNEVIKLLTGAAPNAGLLRMDVWKPEFHTSLVERRADCPACGLGRFDYLDSAGVQSAKRLGMRKAVEVIWRSAPVDLPGLKDSLHSHGTVNYNGHVLSLLLLDAELVIFPDGRVIVRGVADVPAAEALVARCLGK